MQIPEYILERIAKADWSSERIVNLLRQLVEPAESQGASVSMNLDYFSTEDELNDGDLVPRIIISLTPVRRS